MANTDAPFGAKPVRILGGSSWNGQTEPYPILSAYNTTIRFGQFVKVLADGTIGLASAGDTCRGVFLGVEYTATDGTQVFSRTWTASTATLNSANAIAKVVDNPLTVFEIQHDSDSATPALLDNGSNFDWIYTHTAGAEVDTSTSTTGPAGLRVLRLVNRPDNAIGAYAKVEVLINEHDLKSTTGI